MTTRSKPVLPSLDRVPPSSGALSYASLRGEFDTSLTGCRSGEPDGGSRPPGNRDFIKLISAQLNNLILMRCLEPNTAPGRGRSHRKPVLPPSKPYPAEFSTRDGILLGGEAAWGRGGVDAASPSAPGKTPPGGTRGPGYAIGLTAAAGWGTSKW